MVIATGTPQVHSYAKADSPLCLLYLGTHWLPWYAKHEREANSLLITLTAMLQSEFSLEIC